MAPIPVVFGAEDGSLRQSRRRGLSAPATEEQEDTRPNEGDKRDTSDSTAHRRTNDAL